MLRYVIMFNGGSADGRSFDFKEFGKQAQLRLSRGCATYMFLAEREVAPDRLVTFQTSGLPYVKSLDNMTDEERACAYVGYAFRDGYRKAILLHALTQNAGLKVEKISVTVGSSAPVEFTAENHPNFPFMYSMFTEDDLGLSDVVNDPKILKTICETSKTAADNDLRISTLQAYMLSKTRKFELDRFLNLWTAMNAAYNWLAKEFQREKSYRVTGGYAEDILERRYEADSLSYGQREDIVEEAIKAVEKKLSREKYVLDELKKRGDEHSEERARRSDAFLQKLTYGIPEPYLIFSNDREGIAAMMKWICPTSYFPIGFSIENIHAVSLQLQACVAKCTDKSDDAGQKRLHELYDTALARMKDPNAPMNGFDDLFRLAETCCGHLDKIPGKTVDGNIPLYCYLLLAYPYVLRCNLFHGSKVQTVVSAYNDPEMLDYRVVNEFLERFLEDLIPRMFSSSWVGKDKYWYDRLEKNLRTRYNSVSTNRDPIPKFLPDDDPAVRLRTGLLRESILEQLKQYSRY